MRKKDGPLLKLSEELQKLLISIKDDILLQAVEATKNSVLDSENATPETLFKKVIEAHPKIISELGKIIYNMSNSNVGDQYPTLLALISSEFEGTDYILFPLMRACELLENRSLHPDTKLSWKNYLYTLLIKLRKKINNELQKDEGRDQNVFVEAAAIGLYEFNRLNNLASDHDYYLHPLKLAISLLDASLPAENERYNLITECQNLYKNEQEKINKSFEGKDAFAVELPTACSISQKLALEQYRKVLNICASKAPQNKLAQQHHDFYFSQENSAIFHLVLLQQEFNVLFAVDNEARKAITKLIDKVAKKDNIELNDILLLLKEIADEYPFLVTALPELDPEKYSSLLLMKREYPHYQENSDFHLHYLTLATAFANEKIQHEWVKEGFQNDLQQMRENPKNEIPDKNKPFDNIAKKARDLYDQIKNFTCDADFFLFPLSTAKAILESLPDDHFGDNKSKQAIFDTLNAKHEQLKDEITLELQKPNAPEHGIEKLKPIKETVDSYHDILMIFNENLVKADTETERDSENYLTDKNNRKNEISKFQIALMKLLVNDPNLLKDLASCIKKSLDKKPQIPLKQLLNEMAFNYPQIISALGDDFRKNVDLREHSYLTNLFQNNEANEAFENNALDNTAAFYLYPLLVAKEKIKNSEEGAFKNNTARDTLVSKFGELHEKLKKELTAELAKGSKAKPAKLESAKNIAQEHIMMSLVICKKAPAGEEEIIAKEKEAAILKCYENTTRDPWWKTVLKIAGIIAITAACAVAGFLIGSIISHGILGVPGAIKGAFVGAAWGTAMIAGTAIGSSIGLAGSASLFYVPRGITKTAREIKHSALESVMTLKK